MEGYSLVNYDHAEMRLATMRQKEVQAKINAQRDAIGKTKRELWSVSREYSSTLAECARYKRVPKLLAQERDSLEARMLSLLSIVEGVQH